jgi:type II secretion system protein H
MNKKNGFTYLELVVVILVIAVLSSVTLPSMRGVFIGSKLKTTARELYTMLKYAQGAAIFQRKIIELRIDTAQNKYKLVLDNEGEKKVRERKYSRIESVVQLPREVVFAMVNTPVTTKKKQELKSILFYPDGSSSGGEITLISKNNRKFSIFIYPSTGFVELIDESKKSKEQKIS